MSGNNRRNRRNARFERKQFDKDEENNDAPGGSRDQFRYRRHPPHLKGKDIGLFYARQNKKLPTEMDQTMKERKKRPIGRVILSETRQNYIESLLKHSNEVGPMFVIDDGSYDHVSDSSFKRNFLGTIHGNIDDNIQQSPAIERNRDLDEKYFNELINKSDNINYQKMLEFRKKLPSFEKRNVLIETIEKNQVVVISGETGCGKTTQVSQFILDDYILKKKGSLCRIVCTQPRRISAISVAERVADERTEKLGGSIGYQIRLEKRPSRQMGSVTFCTTGVVLKWMESDPCLSNVSHIIIDEIHERDVMSDFIIALLKKIIFYRKDLKIILMSATLNAEKFSSYFNNCPHVNIPGFTYDVEEYYLEDILEVTGFEYPRIKQKFIKRKSNKGYLTKKEKEWADFVEPYIRNLEAKKLYSRRVCNQLRNPQSEEINLDLILTLILHLSQNRDTAGGILVFLTGMTDISSLLSKMEKSNKFPSNRFLIIPLHSLLSTVDQKKIFDKPPLGIRKIIVATNIAETSITIDDIVFVIDCGKIKMSNYNIQTDTQTLLPEWVSLANANQRRGRAGRTQPGFCFHLFTKMRRITLEEFQLPEILRKRLEDTILTLKILKLGKAQPFLQSLLDNPDPKAVENSIRLLIRLNAIDKEEKLTPLGYHLAKLPMAPQMGKMILMGAIFSCVDPILSIAATLDFKDGFVVQLGREKELDQRKLQMVNGMRNDHLVFIKALQNFENSDTPRKFCRENFLSFNTMQLLVNMKRQLVEYLFEMNFVSSANPKCPQINKNSDNYSLVQAVICSGLYPNVAIWRKKINRYASSLKTMEDNLVVKFHPKSLLSTCGEGLVGTHIIVYHFKLKSSNIFIHDASIVNPLSLLFFGDTFIKNESSEEYTVGIGDNINFVTNARTALIVKELRDRLNWFLEYKVANPGPVSWNNIKDDSKILRAIMELITSEDNGELSDSEDDCFFVDEKIDLDEYKNLTSEEELDLIDVDENDDIIEKFSNPLLVELSSCSEDESKPSSSKVTEMQKFYFFENVESKSISEDMFSTRMDILCNETEVEKAEVDVDSINKCPFSSKISKLNLDSETEQEQNLIEVLSD